MRATCRLFFDLLGCPKFIHYRRLVRDDGDYWETILIVVLVNPTRYIDQTFKLQVRAFIVSAIHRFITTDQEGFEHTTNSNWIHDATLVPGQDLAFHVRSQWACAPFHYRRSRGCMPRRSRGRLGDLCKSGCEGSCLWRSTTRGRLRRCIWNYLRELLRGESVNL